MTANKTRAQFKDEWPRIQRADGRVEIRCPHGVGHPSRRLTPGLWRDHMGMHGCDGCCGTAAFAIAEDVWNGAA